MDLTPPEPLGARLLRRARDRGLTTGQLADLLGLPVHRIRQLTTPADVEDLPLRAVRAMAEALALAWPSWLDTGDAPQSPHHLPDDLGATEQDGACASSDADRIHAVLALVLGRPLSLDQIAHVLDVPPERIQHALGRLAALKRGYRGVRIIVGDDQSLQLAIRPHTLDAGTRERLLHLTYQQQGPDPGIALIAFHAGRRDHAALFDLLQGAPNLLATAVAAGYLTYDTDDDGHLVAIQLTPEVTFSLDIATNLHDSLLLDP
ncbi:hypothetical protein ACWEN6_37680 [Sphaerisporangium sp. NPDC004334]